MSYPAIRLLYEQTGRERAEEKHLELSLLLTAMAQLGKGGEKAAKTLYTQLETAISNDTGKAHLAKEQRTRIKILAEQLMLSGAEQG